MSLSISPSDPYGLFHLALNKRPEWLNMGYWRDTDIFPDACEALALKLLDAARYKAGSKVLDVGHGTGESLILLLTHPSIPRPTHLTGITSIPLHHERSLERVKKISSDVDTMVSLHLGDAVYKPGAKQHPLDPASPLRFDTILALDCAYHFVTRESFLRQSFNRLEPGGRVALADICFANSPPTSFKARFLHEYARCLENLGYEDVVLEDISDGVFSWFVRFLKKRGLGWWVFAWVLNWYYRAGARFVLIGGSRPRIS
ncbi:S-adenosyl-L-methionine-dependent methyltransferase [Rhodocollybia butyracea]|uniref:phosphoethanolamine N-methyltransferase n=1 Tax=Rhodocollybia butyracea TaxID=206335 RepID=A0A9P5PSA7_9AGAR|nr:S-adenosyl-L-methionine-dependent methyltransferase [Rhodocollybia butyracea]